MSHGLYPISLFLTGIATASLSLAAQAQSGCAISLVSRNADGSVPPVASAVTPYLTPNGRFVVFESDKSLIPSDPQAGRQIYRLDRASGALLRCSRSQGGGPSNGASVNASAAADGNTIVFQSTAYDLVAGDTNGKTDIFVFDVVLGTTERVSVSSAGQQGGRDCEFSSISADGRWVAFGSASNGMAPGNGLLNNDIFLRDRNQGTTLLVSRSSTGAAGNRDSWGPSLSADGRFCAFQSLADNLVLGDTNKVYDVFVRDLFTGTTTRVSVASNGAEAHGESSWCAISGDGFCVGFTSRAADLVPGDLNGTNDAFVHDLTTGLTELVSKSSAGVIGNGYSYQAHPSFDGSRVAFSSHATNLVVGDTSSIEDVFLHDRTTHTTERWSTAWDGSEASWFCTGIALSADGKSVAFWSQAVNLVPGDTNGGSDVFVRDCRYGPDVVYGQAKVNSQGCTPVIDSVGAPSRLAGAGFYLRARNVVNAQPGLLLYSLAGQASTPFGGGTLLLLPPLVRTIPQSSGGSPPPASDCTGTYSMDFNAWIATGIDPDLQPGVQVWVQYWSRDVGFAPPQDVGLTKGLTFTIGF